MRERENIKQKIKTERVNKGRDHTESEREGRRERCVCGRCVEIESENENGVREKWSGVKGGRERERERHIHRES